MIIVNCVPQLATALATVEAQRAELTTAAARIAALEALLVQVSASLCCRSHARSAHLVGQSSVGVLINTPHQHHDWCSAYANRPKALW